MMPALLVDLGGTHLRCGLADDRRGVDVVRRSRIPRVADGSDSSRTWEHIVAQVAEFAVAVQHMVPPTAPIVLCFPGPVVDGRRILAAPTVTGEAGGLPDLRAMLAAQVGREVHVLNDISAAAWHVSETVDVRRFMVVTVSSGIGSKIFDSCHPNGVLDDASYAGEIGHLTVDETLAAPRCDCGGLGHLGGIASGRGIERQARRLARSDPSFLQSACAVEFGGTPGTLNNEEHIVPAVRLGDSWARGILQDCTAPLARVLLTAVLAAGLRRVVVIGGFALSLGKVYRDLLQDAMASQCDCPFMSSLEDLVVLGDQDACLLGAAAYARRMGWQ